MKIYKFATSVLLAGLLIMALGCNSETHAQKKKAMVEHWEKATANAKLPAIDSMIEQGQIQKAKKTLRKCLESDPDNSQAYVLVGRIDVIEGRNDQAREAFEKAIKLNPDMDQAWQFLGALAVLNKDYEHAIECFQHAIDLVPAKADYAISLSDVYLEMDQLEKAKETINQALSVQPQNLELMLSKARLYQQEGQTDEAIHIYQQAQIMHGNLPEILEPTGYAYITENNWQKAAESFSVLIKQYTEDDPRYNVTMRSLAKCLFNAEQYASALFWYDKLSIIYRDDVDIWLNMAQAALQINDPSRAAYCANRAVKLDPSCSHGYAILGCAHYIQGLYDESLKAFYKISDDKELGGFAWFMSGRCYQQQGQNRQANIAYERAEKMDPDSPFIASFLSKTIHPL